MLIAYGAKLKLLYPSFKSAREVWRKKLPKGKKLVQFAFRDTHENWVEGRPIQLMKDIAKMTKLSKDTMHLVEILFGSVIIVLRLPESAARTIKEKASELKEKFPTLETIKLITESAVLSQPVRDTHFLPMILVICLFFKLLVHSFN